MSEIMKPEATYADVVQSLSDDVNVLAAEIGTLHSMEAECAIHIAARVAKAQAAVWAANGGKQVGWTKWVHKNLPFGERQAQDYIKLSKKILQRAAEFEGLSARACHAKLAAEERDDEAKEVAEHEEANAKTLAEIDAAGPVDVGASARASGEPTPEIEVDARRSVQQIAQRLEAAQAIVGAAVASLESLEAASEGTEQAWLGGLLGSLTRANDCLVDFVECGMTGGGL